MPVARLAAVVTFAVRIFRFAVKMMLGPARASRAAGRPGEDAEAGPAAGRPAAACGAPAPGAAATERADGWEPAGPACEQPASSRAAPDSSPAHMSAVVRSGLRIPRAQAAMFMPLGRTRPRARFRRSGHGPVTGGPGGRGPGGRPAPRSAIIGGWEVGGAPEASEK